MDGGLILLPALALVLLTALVWSWMYYTRIREIRARKIRIQTLADTSRARELLKRVAGPSENLANLFEMPVLFYVAVIVLYMTGLTNRLYLVLAWIFVALRYVHSLIHVSYNRVTHRFTAHVASTLVLWVIWALIAAELFLTRLR
jgi:hypothetical protein